jgi:acyl-CoA thioester hydrolase
VSRVPPRPQDGGRERAGPASRIPEPVGTVRGVTTAQPTYDQLSSLPGYSSQSVPAAFEDINGHLNIRHYVGIASEGLDEALAEVGIAQNWPTIAGQGVFTAEHHMTYLSELRTGDRISTRVRLVGRSERAAHAVVYLVDETHQVLSYVMEEIFLHIDMASRKTAPWPDDVAAAIDEQIAGEADLPWAPALSGSMSLR